MPRPSKDASTRCTILGSNVVRATRVSCVTASLCDMMCSRTYWSRVTPFLARNGSSLSYMCLSALRGSRAEIGLMASHPVAYYTYTYYIFIRRHTIWLHALGFGPRPLHPGNGC